MARAIVRTLLASGVSAGLMIGTGGCSFHFSSSSSHSVSKSDVANQITAKMTGSTGKPDSATCPSDLGAKVGAQLNCKMKFKDKDYDVNATVTSVNGDDVKFDLAEMVDKDQVASRISDKLTEQVGKQPDSVTCPGNLKGVVGTTLRCELTDGSKKYGMTVTVTSVDIPQVYFDYQVDDHPE
ncbi:MAG: DUF4333 domain-containing protein [Mycobacterium sp.]